MAPTPGLVVALRIACACGNTLGARLAGGDVQLRLRVRSHEWRLVDIQAAQAWAVVITCERCQRRTALAPLPLVPLPPVALAARLRAA